MADAIERAMECLAETPHEEWCAVQFHRKNTLVKCTCSRTLRAMLAFAQQAPEGWVLVPREPTEAMLDAGAECDGSFSRKQAYETTEAIWSAMLDASPSVGEGV